MIESVDFQELQEQIKRAGARLVAVSKTHPVAAIEALYAQGQRDFGENRAAELAEKYEQLHSDIRWHMIGHLQRNKVKQIAPFVHLIHTVDSPRLLREIDKRAKQNERRIDCLLQFHIADEESKYGLNREAGRELVKEWTSAGQAPFDSTEGGARLVGVMGMATYTDDSGQVSREFSELADIFAELRTDFFPQTDYFRELSMGMSGDYPLALAAGSTLVRVGSLIFGQRT